MWHQVKIFQGFGKEEIAQLEETVNQWLSDNINDIEDVRGIQTSMAQVADDAASGERFQTYVVTIWYTRRG